MKNKIILAIGIIILLILSAVLYWRCIVPINLYNTGISDEEYIEVARQTIEAKKFFEKYPKAKAYVDRSGLLAVDFRLDKYEKNERGWKYIRLRIFINPRNNRPTRRFIDNSGTIVENNLLEYLERNRSLE